MTIDQGGRGGGLIRSPFGFESTADQVLAGIDLGGRRAIVTGGASGIGLETARALARAGAEVTIADRDVEGAERARADLIATTANEKVDVRGLDLIDRESIDDLAAAWEGPLHILVNSAGVMALPELTLTSAGHEMHFAVNHLGHFALALALRPALAAAGNARVVALSSSAHLRSPVIFDDIDFAFRDYDPFLAYGQSKSACALFAVGLSRRWAADGITSNAVMPGGVATNLQRHVPDYLDRVQAQTDGEVKFKTPQQGAATVALAAAWAGLEGVGGRYLEDCNEMQVLSRRPRIPLGGVAPYAVDPANAERLWELSLRWIEG